MAPLSPLANVGATRSVLEEFGLSTKKALGQHFLVSDGVVRHICSLAEVTAIDDVLEIGPGIGTLTCALLQQAQRVCAIERDTDLLPVLDQTCATWKGSLSVVNMDALKLDAAVLPFAPTKLVANLPYAVAATLALDCFQKIASMQNATVMVQSEVAARMAARPGTKDYGAFTVKLALYAHPQGRFTVPAGNFFPPPHVESTVIRLDRIARPGVSPAVLSATSTMADAAFASRRKTILNSCKTYFVARGLSAVPVSEIFQRAGIDPARRGETLSIDEFIAVGRVAAELDASTIMKTGSME